MDYSKITDNEEVVKLLIQRRSIENQIMKIDKMALINYELERIAEPQANETSTSDEALHIGNVGGSYRMLKDGERIQEGDEFIDHQSKWKMSHSINEIYTTRDYYPHRRLK